MKVVIKNGKAVVVSDAGSEVSKSTLQAKQAEANAAKPSTTTPATSQKPQTTTSNTPKSESADEFWDNYYSKTKETADKLKSEKAAKEAEKEKEEFWDNYYAESKKAAGQSKAGTTSQSVYEQKVAETKAVEKAWEAYAAEEKKAESFKLRNEAAVRRNEYLQQRQTELEKSYQKVEKLKQAYLASGDPASEQAYIQAAEKHNAAVASYQKLAAVQDRAVQNINDQQANLEKLYQNYETKYQKWQASQPENKSDAELKNMIADLDAQIEAANQAITPLFEKAQGYNNLGMTGAAQQQAQSKLEKAYAHLEDLKQQKASLQGYMEQRQALDWERDTEREIYSTGGYELMSSLLNYAKEIEYGQRFTFDKGVKAAAKELKDMGVTDAQLDAWLPYAQRKVNALNYNRQADVAKEFAQSSKVAEKVASVMSVPYRLTGGLGIVDVTLQKLNQKITGDDTPINYKTQGMVGHGIANAIRTGVTENIEARTQGKFGSDTAIGNLYSGAYNLLMSMADSVGVIGLTAMGVPGATLLLGGSAATASMVEVKERGGSDAQALAMGWLSGAAETLFEKVSIDNLITTKPPKGWGDWKTGILNIIAQGGVEASEEVSTTLANTLADMIIMGDKSQLELSVQYFMAEENMTREQAEKAAMNQWWVGLLGDAIGGFVSGGTFGAGGNIVSNIRTSQVESVFAQEERKRQGEFAWIASVIEHASDGSEVQKLAQKIYDQKMAGTKVSLSDMNRLAELTQEDVARFKADPKQQEVLEKLSENEDPAVREYAAAQQANPTVKVVSPYAQELIDSGMKPEQAVEQANLIERVVAGETLTREEQKQMQFSLPAVRTLFTRVTGANATSENTIHGKDRRQVFKSAQEIAQAKLAAQEAQAKQEAPAAQETAQFAEESAPAVAEAQFAEESAPAVAEARFAEESTPAVAEAQFAEEIAPAVADTPAPAKAAPFAAESTPTVSAAPAPTKAAPAKTTAKAAPFVAKNSAVEQDAAVQAMSGITAGRIESGQSIVYADDTSISKKDFVEQYLAEHPTDTVAEAEAAFAARQEANDAGIALPGTASDKVRRRSSAKPSSRAGQISEDIYTGKALSESAQQTERDLTMAELNRMASKFGVKVELRKTDGKNLTSRRNGYYDIKTKTIVLNSDRATNQYLLTRYFVHELTHHAQQIDGNATKGLTSNIIAAMEKIHGKEKVEQLLKETRADYAADLEANGEDLSVLDEPNYIEDEVAADFMMEAIANRALLDRLASVTLKPHQALIQRAMDFLSGRSRGDVGVKEARRLIDRMQKSMATAEKANKKAETGKRLSIDHDESEQQIRQLRNERDDISEQLNDPFNELSADERKKLNNRLAKVDHELDKRINAERRASVKTPYQTILDNLNKYRTSDLESLAEQISEGNWDYEELSTEELRDGLRETIEERIADMSPLEAQSSKFGLFVRPPAQDVRYSIDRETGYEEGSVQDRVLKLLDAGTPEEAIELLQKWSEDVKAGKVEVQEGEKAIAEQMKAYKPVTEEEAIANRKKLDELIEQYGKIRTGEKAARIAPFPKKVDHLEGVSKHAQTVAEYAGTPEWMKVEIEKAVVNKQAGFSYQIITDDAAMAYVDSLHNQDFNSLMEQWNKIVGGNTRVGKMEIALGEYLYTQAIRRGDMTSAIQLISELCAIGTQASQTVQAMSLLKKMTPAGQLYYLQKAVDRMNEKASKTPPKLTDAEAKQRSELRQQQEAAQQELEEAETALQEALDAESAVKQAEADVESVEAQIQTILEKLDQVDSEVMMSEFEGVQGQLEEVKALEREVRQAEKQVDAAKKRLAEKDIEAIKKKAFATKEELEKVKALEADLRSAEKRLTTAQERLSKYDTEGTKAKIAETQEQIDRFKELRDEAKELEAKLKKLTEKWEKTADERAKIEADLTALREAIREIYNQRADLRKMKAALKRAQETWTKLRPTRTATEAQLAAIRKRVEEAKAQKATARGKLNEIKKAVKKLNEQIEERNADALFKWGYQPMIHIDAGLAEQLLNAKSEKEMNEARGLLLQHIADQVPVTWAEKWNAWRYLAMLGNPKTHVRNLISNAVFQPVVFMKDMVGSVLETVFHPGSNPGGLKTKHFGQALASGVYGFSLARKHEGAKGIKVFGRTFKPSEWRVKVGKYVKFADQDYLSMVDVMTGGGKHNVADEIRDKRHIFGKRGLGGAVDWLSRTNSKLMENEDQIALQTHYVRALSQYLAANKADVSKLTNTPEGQALLAKARAYAMLEAQKATFRDASALATALNRLEKSGVAGQLLVGSVLPFKKTPINILKRGVEYSPLGIAKTVYGVIKNKGDAENFIDNLSSNLTGTAIMYVGFYLASQGLLRAGGSDDERERKFEELWGEQSYSIKLLDGTSYTIDWMAPAALPLFVGVEWFNLKLGKKDGQFTMADFLDAMSMLSGPMFQLSMLDGLSSTLESAGYGDNPLPQVGMSLLTNYFGQAIPTLWGQINRTFFDDTSRGTFIQAGTVLQPFQRAYQTSFLGKIPGKSDERVPYLDAWGRAETQPNLLMRAFENFLSPGYSSKVEKSAMEDELLRLYKATGEGGVLPSTVAKYFNVKREDLDGDGVLDGVRHNLTADEWVTYQTTTGQLAYDLITELVNSAGYAELTDAEKVRAIESIYDYADEQGRAAAVSDYKIDVAWVEKAEGLLEKGISLTEFVTINARDKATTGQSKLDVIGMSWLDDADRAAVIGATKIASLSNNYYLDDPDPARSNHGWVLTDEQNESRQEYYDQLWTKESAALMNGSYYKGLSAEDQAALLGDLESSVLARTNIWLAKQMTTKSQVDPTSVSTAMKNCPYRDELSRLYNATGEAVILSDASSTIGGVQLTGEQLVQYREKRTEATNEILGYLFESEFYKSSDLDDETRAKVTAKALKFVDEVTKAQLVEGYAVDGEWIKRYETWGVSDKVSAEEYAIAIGLANANGDGDGVLDVYRQDQLNEVQKAYVALTYYDKGFGNEGKYVMTDKARSGRRFYLTEEQRTEYLEYYDYLFAQEVQQMILSSKYQNADAEGRAKQFDKLKSEVANDTKRYFSYEWPRNGIYSEPKR